MSVAVLLTAFVVDVGNWFEHQRHLQVQADAAAFAAAAKFNYPCTPAVEKSIYQAAGQYGGAETVLAPGGKKETDGSPAAERADRRHDAGEHPRGDQQQEVLRAVERRHHDGRKGPLRTRSEHDRREDDGNEPSVVLQIRARAEHQRARARLDRPAAVRDGGRAARRVRTRRSPRPLRQRRTRWLRQPVRRRTTGDRPADEHRLERRKRHDQMDRLVGTRVARDRQTPPHRRAHRARRQERRPDRRRQRRRRGLSPRIRRMLRRGRRRRAAAAQHQRLLR